jgi:hypothetical protein
MQADPCADAARPHVAPRELRIERKNSLVHGNGCLESKGVRACVDRREEALTQSDRMCVGKQEGCGPSDDGDRTCSGMTAAGARHGG